MRDREVMRCYIRSRFYSMSGLPVAPSALHGTVTFRQFPSVRREQEIRAKTVYILHVLGPSNWPHNLDASM